MVVGLAHNEESSGSAKSFSFLTPSSQISSLWGCAFVCDTSAVMAEKLGARSPHPPPVTAGKPEGSANRDVEGYADEETCRGGGAIGWTQGVKPALRGWSEVVGVAKDTE